MSRPEMWSASVFLVALALAAPALSQDFAVSWYTVDGGGGRSAGAGFEIAGTIGQPDAGSMVGGDYEVLGGFWGSVAAQVVDVVDDTPANMPRVFRVHQASPNPFNPTTTIRYELPAAAHVSLRIFDLQGKLVTVLADGVAPAGHHMVRWDGNDHQGAATASGVYVLDVRAGAASSRQKLILLR